MKTAGPHTPVTGQTSRPERLLLIEGIGAEAMSDHDEIMSVVMIEVFPSAR
ncbi:hypothetical protein [Leucobacter sp. wl10]|uniref:hypothetical protein n=1 Tax=Leucobacter sp. wl10 TaxID=2304677 RepID=UPI0013C351D3|nr:hypothetical protein [Leucobacter sp. wl10]